MTIIDIDYEGEMGLVTLDRLEPGDSGIVREIDAGHALRRRLWDMGILPGSEIKVVRLVHGTGPRQITVKGYQLALGYGECLKIFVDQASARKE